MRSDDEILAGVLTVQVGGAERSLRVLRITEERVWTKQFGEAVGSIANLDVDLSAPSAMSQLAGVVATKLGDGILGLVLAYDVDNVLGGRTTVEAAASTEEVYRAFRQIFEVVNPFVRDVQTAISYLQMILKATPSTPASSTNGPSPTGVSGRKRSKVA